MISVAVTASLIIAVSIIPTAAAKWLHGVKLEDPHSNWWESITNKIMGITDHKRTRQLLIGSMFTAATVLTWLLLPPANYLPEGKQGWIFAYIMQPPGQSVTTARSEFADPVIERIGPYLEEGADLQVDSFFMGMFGTFAFAGLGMVDAEDADEMINRLNGEILGGFPGYDGLCRPMGNL